MVVTEDNLAKATRYMYFEATLPEEAETFIQVLSDSQSSHLASTEALISNYYGLMINTYTTDEQREHIVDSMSRPQGN